MSRPDDAVPRDAWLREALRHAPDADAAAPPALSDVILRQARAAAAADARPARPASPSFGARIAAAWAWLGRPPVAASFASVMVAGVVGLMWWNRPLEESLPPRDATLAAAAPAASPSPPAPPPAPAPAPAPAPLPAEVAAAPVAAAPPPPKAVARRQAPTHAPAPPAAPTAAAEAAVAPPPAPLPLPVPMLADAAPRGAAVESERRAMATAREERDDRGRALAALSKAAPAAASPAAGPALAAAPALRRAAAPDAAARTPLAALRESLAAQPERWRWQRDAGGPRTVEPALQQWLARADAAADPRGSAESTGAAATASDAVAVQFWFDERLHTTLRVDAASLVVEPAGGPPRRVELPAADIAALRDALERATR